MAKYKVGDKVKVGGHTATIVKILGTSASGEQMCGVKQDDNGWAYESLEGKMKAANASSKFQPGTKVFVRMYPYNKNDSRGGIGVIKKNRGNTMDVEIDGKTIEVDYRFLTPSPNAANADVVNGRHFSGPANDLADKIAKLVNKWMDAPESKKDDAFNRLNTEIRAASSLGGGVWAMRDGTIAIAPEKPRGAQRLTDYLKTLNSKECNTTIKSTNPIVANAIKACNGNNWTMADAKEWASSLSVIADKDYNDDWLKEGLDSFKRYGKQFTNLVGPSEAKKVEDAIRKGRAKDLPRLIGSMKPYKANGSLVNPVVANALDEKYKTISTPFGTFYNSKNATNADRNPESLANWKRILPKLKEFNNLAGWLKGEGAKLMNVARNFDDKKFHSIGYDIQSVCEWSERKSAEILKQA